MNKYIKILVLILVHSTMLNAHPCGKKQSHIEIKEESLIDTDALIGEMSKRFNRPFRVCERVNKEHFKESLQLEYDFFGITNEIEIEISNNDSLFIQYYDLLFLELAKKYVNKEIVLNESVVLSMIKQLKYFKKIKVTSNSLWGFDVACKDKRYKRNFFASFYSGLVQFHYFNTWLPHHIDLNINNTVPIDYKVSPSKLKKYKIAFLMRTPSPSPTQVGESEIFVFDCLTHELTEKFSVCRASDLLNRDYPHTP